jgi:hypothetical protein
MNKIDLIIEAIRLAEYHVKARGWGDDIDLELYTEALAAARDLRELKPVAWVRRRITSEGRVLDGFETCDFDDYGAIPVYILTRLGDEMTDTKPEALRLAKVNEFLAEQTRQDKKRSIMVRLFDDNAKELRRLHEVNAELLEALNKITLVQNGNPVIMYQAMEDIARAAIAKAEVTK